MELGVMRKERGYTQRELAELVGVRRETIARYEQGARLPSKAVMMRLADCLCVPLKEVVFAFYDKQEGGKV